MTVRRLINILQSYDLDMEVVLGEQQTYGSDFAKYIKDVDEYTVQPYYGDNFKAVIITEDEQCGVVDYDGEYDEDSEEDW